MKNDTFFSGFVGHRCAFTLEVVSGLAEFGLGSELHMIFRPSRSMPLRGCMLEGNLILKIEGSCNNL